MKNVYEQCPLSECGECAYRGSKLSAEEALELSPRLLPPISLERSCGRDYCLIDNPAKG